jgi:hypothetical protein
VRGDPFGMVILELVQPRPDWMGALRVALTRPAGVPERRGGDDPWQPRPAGRPRRISDDLAWLRHAMDDPSQNGLRPLDDTAAVAAWESDDPGLQERLGRLRDRGTLLEAGFLLHEPESELAH